jgi:DNA-binding response OmpR family regulator
MKVLLLEDEIELAQSIKKYLSTHQLICENVSLISQAIQKISSYDYDCVILDLMLPDGNGLDVLKELKKMNKAEGIILLTAKDTLESKIEGLQLGADDYLTKPFHLSELLVRIQALIRRKKFQGSSVIQFEEIEINILARSVLVSNETLSITKSELDLLLYLIGNKGNVLSKSAIAEHLSGDMADTLDSHDFIYAHIKNLKKKLLEAGCTDYIHSVYGLGYKWHND